jgi:hypothetical protein
MCLERCAPDTFTLNGVTLQHLQFGAYTPSTYTPSTYTLSTYTLSTYTLSTWT